MHSPMRVTRSLLLRSSQALASQPSLLLEPQRQTRAFINSILSSALGSCPLRSLTHTKTLPYSASSIFKAVSDVSGYPAFLPFAISSNVTMRDEKGYPSQASLKIGYDRLGLEEIWDSNVKCDPDKGTVEAQSCDDRSSQGLFEVLQTKWHIEPAEGTRETQVKLDLRVKFRNPVYDQMFAQVEGKVANVMISAFEKKVQELEAAER